MEQLPTAKFTGEFSLPCPWCKHEQHEAQRMNLADFECTKCGRPFKFDEAENGNCEGTIGARTQADEKYLQWRSENEDASEKQEKANG